MTFYEINATIRAILNGSVDEETGEINTDYAALDELFQKREDKITSCGKYYLEEEAEIKAIKEAEKKLKERREKLENKHLRFHNYIEANLGGEEFKCPEFTVSYRTSKSVELDDDFMEYAKKRCKKLLRAKYEPDKTAIKALIESGKKVPHAEIITNTKMKIK